MNEVGVLIKKRRKVVNITQQVLAKKIGVKSSQYISNAERGISPLATKYIRKVAKALKLDVNKVLVAVVNDYRKKVKLEVLKTR
jgi:transcriptional regulator with XRE-family HTH domain